MTIYMVRFPWLSSIAESSASLGLKLCLCFMCATMVVSCHRTFMLVIPMFLMS